MTASPIRCSNRWSPLESLEQEQEQELEISNNFNYNVRKVGGGILKRERTQKLFVNTMQPIHSINNQTVERPFLQLIINDHKVPALVDSGSHATVLREDVFLSLTNPQPLQYSLKELSAATGTPLNNLGEWQTQVKIRGNTYYLTFTIVRQLNVECILGTDAIKGLGILIDSNLNVTLGNAGNRIRLAKRCTVEPNSERLWVGTPDHQITAGLYLIDEGPFLSPGLIVVKSKNVPIVLRNVSNEPKTFLKGQEMGQLFAVSEGDLLQEMRPTYAQVTSITSGPKSCISEQMVDLSKIPERERGRYLQLLNEFKDIFSLDPTDLGHCEVLPQRIILKDPSKITCIPPYRIPHHLLPVVDEYVNTLLRLKVIRKSTSPFSSPLMLVQKPIKEGIDPSQIPITQRYRIVHDFRKLNSNTIKDSYPMRNLYEMIDDVSQGNCYSVIDMSNAFWSQDLDPSSCQFMAFGVPGKGHFEYTRSAQGLCNSPASFQRLLDFVMQGLPRVYVYIDDVVLADRTHREHLETLRKVFERFRKYNLKCRLSKLQIGAAEINYLGYNISKEKGIRAGLGKIEAIKRWAEPASVTEIKQFLGLCSFFRRTIKDFAVIAGPLTRLTRKDAKWRGGALPEEASRAFFLLKEKLSKRPCLQPVNFDEEFILTVDGSSQLGFGAILSQFKNGVEHPCAYASKSLGKGEKNAAATVAEAQAILWACKHFRPYLQGKHFIIRSDHRPLQGLNRLQGQTLERIHAELEMYQPFTIKYLPGKKMPADGLSRLGGHRPRETINSIENSLPQSLLLSWEQIHALQKDDILCKALVCALSFNSLPMAPTLREKVQKLKGKVCLLQNVLCVRSKEGQILPMAPAGLRQSLVQICHDNPISGHFSSHKTYNRIKAHWWWENMQRDVEIYCRNCHKCASVNLPHSLKPLPLQEPEHPRFFGDIVSIDLLGPLPSSPEGHKYLLVATDCYSKWIELIPLLNKTTDHVATNLLTGWVHRHGCFRTLRSDKGSEFDSKLMVQLKEKLGFKHIFSSVAHPMSNGISENHNRMILNYLRKYLEDSNDWVDLLPSICFAYNTSVHSSTKYTPFFLVYNRRPTLPHQVLFNDAPLSYATTDLATTLNLMQRTRQRVLQELHSEFLAQKAQFDKRAELKQLAVGDRVYIRKSHSGTQFQKFQPIFRGPLQILKLLPNNNVELQEEITNKKYRCHSNLLKLVPFVLQNWDTMATPGSTPETTTTNGANITVRADDNTLWDEDDDNPFIPPPRTPFSSRSASPTSSSDSFSDEGAQGPILPPPPPLPPQEFFLAGMEPPPLEPRPGPSGLSRGTVTKYHVKNVAIGPTLGRFTKKITGKLPKDEGVVVRYAEVAPDPPEPIKEGAGPSGLATRSRYRKEGLPLQPGLTKPNPKPPK